MVRITHLLSLFSIQVYAMRVLQCHPYKYNVLAAAVQVTKTARLPIKTPRYLSSYILQAVTNVPKLVY